MQLSLSEIDGHTKSSLIIFPFNLSPSELNFQLPIPEKTIAYCQQQDVLLKSTDTVLTG